MLKFLLKHALNATHNKGGYNVSFYLAEKEIPILVKQEQVEIKEPVIEADKFKSRYKKFIPIVPPNPVSRNIFGFRISLCEISNFLSKND